MAKVDPKKLKAKLGKKTASSDLRKGLSDSGIRKTPPRKGGVSSVLRNVSQEDPKDLVKNFMMVPIEQISPNKYQPRQDFEEEALQQLADSIKEFGVIQPITVRADEQYEAFMIISGERRWRASQIAGLTEIPAYIRTPEDQEMAEMALVENLYREDLNPLEIAITYDRLMTEFELTHQELAKRVEKGRATITNFIRLLKLSALPKSKLRDGGISMGHAKAILGIGDKVNLQDQLCEEIITENLSVREAEKRASIYKNDIYAKLFSTAQEHWIKGLLDAEKANLLVTVDEQFAQNKLAGLLIEKDIFESDAREIIEFFQSAAYQKDLATEVRHLFLDGKLNLEQTEALAEVSDKEKQSRIAKNFLSKLRPPNQSELHKLIANSSKKKVAKKPNNLPPVYQKIQDKLREKVGSGNISVQLQSEEKGMGKIVLKFEDSAQLNQILDYLDIIDDIN